METVAKIFFTIIGIFFTVAGAISLIGNIVGLTQSPQNGGYQVGNFVGGILLLVFGALALRRGIKGSAAERKAKAANLELGGVNRAL